MISLKLIPIFSKSSQTGLLKTIIFFCPLTCFLPNISYAAHHTKRDLMGIVKSIDHGQPAQPVQADHGLNFSLLAGFLCIKWKSYVNKLFHWNYTTVSACAYFIPIFLIIISSRSSNKVPFCEMGHIFNFDSLSETNLAIWATLTCISIFFHPWQAIFLRMKE